MSTLMRWAGVLAAALENGSDEACEAAVKQVRFEVEVEEKGTAQKARQDPPESLIARLQDCSMEELDGVVEELMRYRNA